MLELRNVSSGYGKEMVLNHVNLSVPAGKVTTIIGNNGCGKSTLLKTVIGLLPASEGEILIGGEPATNLSPAELARQVAYLAQGKNVPDISVERMVLHGRFPHLHYPRRYRKQDYKITQEAMEQMGISHLAQRPVAELSGGMRQKVYIAMALAQQASVILLDEPTTYLDVGQQVKLAELIRTLSAQGKTILLVLHDIALALKYSDNIAVMEEGRIVQRGTPEEILESGAIRRLYGVKMGTVETEKGRQFYYEL